MVLPEESSYESLRVGDDNGCDASAITPSRSPAQRLACGFDSVPRFPLERWHCYQVEQSISKNRKQMIAKKSSLKYFAQFYAKKYSIIDRYYF